MAIPEDQLETWANIGAQVTSKTTYATIKGCLDAGEYGGRSFRNFLQGSYGNDTNIRVESDVDIVMELTGAYYYDLSALPVDQKQAFQAQVVNANYSFNDFRKDVATRLSSQLGADVQLGTKAIRIQARGSRRKADVLACVKHHKLTFFAPGHPEQKLEGICFFKSDGTQVVNYPRLHAESLTRKNQATNGWFKPIVRVFKNARERLIAKGQLTVGVAPSYYIEGLLYNVPPQLFGTTYAATMYQCLDHLYRTDRSQFTCAHGQYPLLDGLVDVTWNAADCSTYINAMIRLWNERG